MRRETNNEIDLLLRRLSRRQDAPVSADSDHLDADELSSYAENVLPAAARARYTEHLAECARCRELVVQLSASVPVVAAKENVTAAVPSGLRKFLASFFSPMVLRYAVPALGLIVVAAIGFVLPRSHQSRMEVAQLEPRATQPTPVTQPDQNAQKESAGLVSQARTSQAPAATPETQAEKTKKAEPDVAPPPPNAPASVTVRVEPKADAPLQDSERQAVANAAPSQSPKPAETVDEMRVEVQGQKPAEQSRAGAGSAVAKNVAKDKADEAAKTEEKKTREVAPQTAARAKTSPAGRVQADGTFRAAEQDKERDDAATRNVGGRRFRKQGGVWVDTAYNSGSSVVNIARGSEQYRALVADEPEIKTIADQLDGAIIVVWKGRTYRIR